ncbi:GNAT family N-acetyltransferase [Lacrimispora brassicae]
MIIRPVNTGDSRSFLDMLKQLDRETSFMMLEPGERMTTVEDMQANIRNMGPSGSLTLILEDEERIAGFLSASRGTAARIRHRAYIVTGILKDYRGKGLGEKLFKELEKWALEHQVTRLELTVMTHNEAAIRLYKRMGFKIEGTKEKSLLVNGTYVDEYYMGKIL